MASCSYSSLLEGKSSFMSFPCGSNWKNPEDFSCITLRDCNLDVSSHLTSCKVADDRIENEVQLLLARAGTVLLVIIMPDFQTFRSAFEPSLYLSYHVVSLSLLFIGVFIIEESHTLLTVCPRHRDKYGVGWRTGKVRCSIPSEIAGHKSLSARRSWNQQQGVSFRLDCGGHVSSNRNTWENEKLSNLCALSQFPSSNFTPPKTTVEMFRRGSSAFAGYFFPQGVILT